MLIVNILFLFLLLSASLTGFFWKEQNFLEFMAFVQCLYIIFCIGFDLFPGYSPRLISSLTLLNGPILYLIYIKQERGPVPLATRIFHLLPFVFVFLKDDIIYLFDGINYSFINLNILLGVISQISYSIWICRRKNWDSEIALISIVVKQISFIFLTAGILNIAVFLECSGFKLDFGFNVYVLTYLFPLPVLIVILNYLFFLKKGVLYEPDIIETDFSQKIGYKKNIYRCSTLDSDDIPKIERLINNSLTQDKLYLQSNLSLDILSEYIGIPKSHISQVLNGHMQTNFYNLIAAYRVQHALRVMNSNKNLKIEAIAYDSGFNSFSVFNRYFKEIVGVVPSNYLKQL